jgi:hypothetical protein
MTDVIAKNEKPHVLINHISKINTISGSKKFFSALFDLAYYQTAPMPERLERR